VSGRVSGRRHAPTYTNCWEDADLLVSRLGDIRGRRVLSIGSGGENSLSLLCREPGLLVVVDKSPAQLFLFELKKVALKALERPDFLAFLGYAESTDRWRTYGLVRGDLGPRAGRTGTRSAGASRGESSTPGAWSAPSA